MLAHCKAGFDPDTIRVLQEAFDAAWSEVAAMPIVSTDPGGARDFIAIRILAAVRVDGERDPERLKAYALLAFQTPV